MLIENIGKNIIQKNMLQIQTKNRIDKPTIRESIKELVKMSVLVGGLYFLTGLQDIDFDIYTGVVLATADVLVKLIQEIKKGK